MQAEREIELRKHLWTHDEYLKASELGWFKNQRTELIEGEIIYMSAMSVAHFQAVVKASEVLQLIFARKGFFVSTQCPLGVNNISDPEPDVAVIAGELGDYEDALPNTAVLVVEVSESSLKYDRTEKASLYAKANVPDYWIVNLRDRRLEVRRRPIEDVNFPFSYSYADVSVFTEKDLVAPLAKPETQISVADLLPKNTK